MEDNNKLIPIANNSLVQKTTVSLAITNKLLAENYRKLILEIAERNPQLMIDCLLFYYPISTKELEILKKNRNKNNFNIVYLLGNKKLIWSIDLIEKLIQDFNWKLEGNYLFYSNGLNSTFNIDILNKHSNEIEWDFLSYNENITWSNDLIEKFKDKWNWRNLSQNKNLPWSLDFIEKYIDNWNWEELSSNKSLPWSLDFFEKYIDKLDFQYLSGNVSLPWSEDFFEEHFDKWCNTKARRFEKDGQNVWTYYSENHNRIWYLGAIECVVNKNGKLFNPLIWLRTTDSEVFLNEVIQENIDDLNKGLLQPIEQYSLKPFYKGQEEDIYKNQKLGRYSNYRIATNEEALKLNRRFIDVKEISDINIPYRSSDKNIPFWMYLSSNKNLPWSEEFFEKYIDRWDWYFLSRNENLPWSLDFFEKYIDKWHWSDLSRNEGLPWSLDFFEKHLDRWDFENLSWNKSLPWTFGFIEKYFDKWNWQGLSYNNGIKWNINMINKHAEKIKSSEIIWDCIKEYVDDDLVIEILNKYE